MSLVRVDKDRKVIISNNKVLVSPTPKELEKIKESLTFNNPLYEQTQKYSKYGNVAVPPYLFYFKEGRDKDTRKKTISVPIGYELKCKRVIDQRVFEKVETPPFLLTPRGDQIVASNNFYRMNEDEVNGIMQLPTGKGKSILGLLIASHYSCKTLILVHKDDLVTGWKNDIALAFGGKVKSGLIKAQKRDIGDFLTIATIQTLNNLKADELEKLYNTFGLVIHDECLVGDTLIVKEDGGIVKINTIVNTDKVLGGEVSNSFSRKSKTIKVLHSKGVIQGSPTHPTFCVERVRSHNKSGYSLDDFKVKRLMDLTTNDLIPTLIKMPHTQKNEFSAELLSFIGAVMCSGHLDKPTSSNRTKISISKNRDFYTQVFEDGCKCFGAESYSSLNCRNDLTLWTNDKNLKTQLMNKFLIPSGKKENIVEIPPEFYYSPLKSIKAFIETCFNCAGDLNTKKNGHRINFNTSSKQFALGLMHLIRKFGVVINYQEVKSKDKSNLLNYHRLVCGGNEFNKFMDTFSLIDSKNTSTRNTNCINQGFYVGDYFLSDIKSVEKVDVEEDVFDFEVEGTHSFIANGALTHNCHNSPARCFGVVDKFKSRYKMGLSATPERSDGLAHVFNLYFGGFCYVYKNTGEENDILPVKVIIKKTNIYFNPLCKLYNSPSFKGYKIVKLDYDGIEQKEGTRTIDKVSYTERPKLHFGLIDDYVVTHNDYLETVCTDIIAEYRKGRSIVAFFTKKEHVRLYADYLENILGENVVALFYGDTKNNDEVLIQAENGDRKITLTTYKKGTEGTNVKAWEVEFLVSSINNGKNVEQAVGRIRRTKEGKISPVIVYDYRHPDVYLMHNHGETRDIRYRKLGFDYGVIRDRTKKNMFTRGYK